MRISDTTHKIALGLTLGVGISFTPFIGTHFIQVGILAFIFRANVASALIGTFVGNPWTFPFMWWAALRFGSYLLGLFGVAVATALPAYSDFSALWDVFTREPVRILLPWALGGYLLTFLSVFVSYPVFYKMVSQARAARKKARTRRIHKVAKEITGQKT